VNSSGSRLALFEKISGGTSFSPQDSALPHILGLKINESNRKLPSKQQEHCWKALLLKSRSPTSVNEWDLVQGHFEKSRSKKVLTIIQQKKPDE
jgi:hypothetical protein